MKPEPSAQRSAGDRFAVGFTGGSGIAYGLRLVEVLLQQHIEHHPQAAPLFAALAMPDLGSVASRFDAARTIAQHLPAGTLAIVTGQGLEPGHQAGQPVLRVIRTNSIKPLGQQLVDESRAGALQPDPAPAPIRQGADHAH